MLPPRLFLPLALLSALAVAGCSNSTSKPQTNPAPIRDAAAMFLTAQANQDANWVCYTSNQDYWHTQGWASNGAAREDECVQGYNKWKASLSSDRIQKQALFALSRSTGQAQLQLGISGHSADLEFAAANPRVCSPSQMSLHQQKATWKVTAFKQGRCMGLVTKV